MEEKHLTDKQFNSIVVGGGIAGLTSTVYLARWGQKKANQKKEPGGLVNSCSSECGG